MGNKPFKYVKTVGNTFHLFRKFGKHMNMFFIGAFYYIHNRLQIYKSITICFLLMEVLNLIALKARPGPKDPPGNYKKKTNLKTLFSIMGPHLKLAVPSFTARIDRTKQLYNIGVICCFQFVFHFRRPYRFLFFLNVSKTRV